MTERRKTTERRNKLPKEPLPLYYNRRIPDRRQDKDPPGGKAGAGGDPAALQIDGGD